MRKPLIYALLTGIALGCYLLSWIGGALVILIIFAFAIVQYIIDHLRGRSTDYLCIIAVVFLVIALVMVLPFTKQIADVKLHIASVLLGIMMFLVLSGLSRVMSGRSVRRLY